MNRSEYEAYKSRYLHTTTSKYPDCLPMSFEDWKKAQILNNNMCKGMSEAWANAG